MKVYNSAKKGIAYIRVRNNEVLLLDHRCGWKLDTTIVHPYPHREAIKLALKLGFKTGLWGFEDKEVGELNTLSIKGVKHKIV